MEEKEQLKAETALPTEDVTETSSTAVEAPVADASTEQKGANDKKGDKKRKYMTTTKAWALRSRYMITRQCVQRVAR